MTYYACTKSIMNNKKRFEETKDRVKWEAFKVEMKEKLDIFLLNNRIDKGQYDQLNALMEE